MLRVAIPLLAILFPATTLARPITVEFEAVVREVVDDFELLAGVAIGSVVAGAYLYDDKVPNNSALSFVGEFRYDAVGKAGFEFSAGSAVFDFRNDSVPERPLEISVLDHIEGDQYRVRWIGVGDPSRRAAPFTPLTINEVSLAVVGSSLVSGPYEVTPPPPSLGGATMATLTFVAQRNLLSCRPIPLCPTESSFSSDLTLLRIVPEPTAVGLLGVALGVGFALRRRI